MQLRRYLATSDDAIAVLVRRLRRGVMQFTLPAPRVVVRPLLLLYVTGRQLIHGVRRLVIAEPLFKAYCTSYGANVRTGIFVHWVMGKGDLILGDNVEVRGKSSFSFASRFADRPTLRIGSHTNIGHSCSFVVGKAITIGDHCLIASDVVMFDSNGHPSDPLGRLNDLPLSPEDVRPIVIGNNVWIGQRSIISPGVKIGDNSIVSAGAVVISEVPANAIVAGNPARKIGSLTPPASATAADATIAPVSTAPAPAADAPIAAVA